MNLDHVVRSLLALPKECEWVEFKLNNEAPQEIGELLSALANSAALHDKDAGFLVWGIDDATRTVVGTTAKPRQRKIGNEEIENWLAHNLEPRINFQFHEWAHDDRHVVMLRVEPATAYPVAFKGTEWIRIGGVKKKLKEHPGKEKDLWQTLARRPFEGGIARPDVTGDDVLASLDYPQFFELLGQSLPSNRTGILDRLTVERLVVTKSGDVFDITNLGAILFAKQLSQFDGLARKALRVVRYKGVNRVETLHEKVGQRGYAAGFAEQVDYINDQVPRNEVMGAALRGQVRMYPERAIRELVANALIHQDFSLAGTGPMVEMFDDRIELSNPGLPVIEPLRFIDHAPRSRNETLADLMRRVGVCEERGSGFDKVVTDIEVYQLPAPDVRIDTTHTRIILFAHRDLQRMDRNDRIRACYQHCCLLFVTNRVMTNSTLRDRFGIEASKPAGASRIIRESVNAGLVRPEDPTNRSRKHTRYVPFWA